MEKKQKNDFNFKINKNKTKVKWYDREEDNNSINIKINRIQLLTEVEEFRYLL